MKTIYHAYAFDTATQPGAAAYKEFCAARRADGCNVFATLKLSGESYYRRDLDGQELELETEHVFNNQWNTAPIPGISELGLRVFDWAEDVVYVGYQRTKMRRGHWLEQTDEMRAIRLMRQACGYCGAQYAPGTAPADGFCDRCIDSAYLKPDDLPLLRLLPCGASFDAKRAPLTDTEAAVILPRYASAQVYGATIRGAKELAAARAKIEREHAELDAKVAAMREAAESQYVGGLWILENFGVGILGNAIFYTHTGRWGFGWRTPLAADVVSLILDKISEFPAPYDLTCADGRKLSGG